MHHHPDLPWSSGRPGRSGDPTLRVSDAERNEVADLLSRHYADGRLDANEFKERVDATMAAKTRSDLSGVLNDLPPLGPTGTPPRRPRRSRVLLWVALAALIALWSVPWPAYHGLWVPHLPLLLVALGVFWVLRCRRRSSAVT
jgi:hypothetical protein